MHKWRKVGLALGAVGIADAAYFFVEFLNGSVQLYCPTSGALNCAVVTASAYSRFLGVPVALLGALWFVAMTALFAIDSDSLIYVLLPLWVLGIAFAGYLIFAELVLVGAICPYCTVAHAVAVLMGVPVIKLTLA